MESGDLNQCVGQLRLDKRPISVVDEGNRAAASVRRQAHAGGLKLEIVNNSGD